jgi:hypothetical protein
MNIILSHSLSSLLTSQHISFTSKYDYLRYLSAGALGSRKTLVVCIVHDHHVTSITLVSFRVNLNGKETSYAASLNRFELTAHSTLPYEGHIYIVPLGNSHYQSVEKFLSGY